jgi:membrane-bound lytic murein transglycosylase B
MTPRTGQLPRSRGPCPAITTLLAAALAACATSPGDAPLPLPSSVSPAPASPPEVDEAARQQAAFMRWIADFSTRARATGIDDATLRAAFADVRLLPRVVELDRAQPEFTRTVWDYLDVAVSAQRVALGRERLAQVHTEAVAADARYGVPAAVIAAIWGIESNFGSHVGSTPVIDALATLGFDGRREAWAREQLLAALKILQSKDIDRAHMVGSWAGAMGQTQFIPSAFLAHAVDGDGDGRRDLWGSMADVLQSTANFLARAGWQAGAPWGMEVRLPPGFDPARADDGLRQPASRWADEGVRAMNGEALPDLADAAILLPAGARGPAFLVGANFRAILRYNNSTSYALAVGLLAQRLVDGPEVQAAWPRELPALTRRQVQELQAALNQRGFDAGPADGLMGPSTRAGLRRFQQSIGQPADGYPTPDLLQQLQAPP